MGVAPTLIKVHVYPWVLENLVPPKKGPKKYFLHAYMHYGEGNFGQVVNYCYFFITFFVFCVEALKSKLQLLSAYLNVVILSKVPFLFNVEQDCSSWISLSSAASFRLMKTPGTTKKG